MNDRNKTTLVPRPQTVIPVSPVPPPRGPHGARRRTYMLVGLGVLTLAVVAAGIMLMSSVESESPADDDVMATFDGHSAHVVTMAFSADGETAVSGDETGTLVVWNPTSRERKLQLKTGSSVVRRATVSLDGRLAATGDDDGLIRVWNLETGKQTLDIPAHGGEVTSLVLYPTKQYLLSGGRDGRLALWNLSERKLTAEHRLDQGEVTAAALTPDGLTVVVGDSRGVIRFFNLATMSELAHAAAHAGAVADVATSPRGGRAVSAGSDGVVCYWDVDGRRQLASMKCAGGEPPRAVAISAGGTRAVSIARRGGAELWSLEDQRLIDKYPGDDAPQECCALYPAGTFFAAADSGASIRLWRIPVPPELEVSRAREAAAAAEARLEKFRRFGEQIGLATQRLDEDRPQEAAKEFAAAAAAMPRDSLEFCLARDAADKLNRNVTALERYAELCRAAKTAAENQEFEKAKTLFQQADDALRDADDAGEYTEAKQGLREVDRLSRLKQALDGIRIKEQVLDFAAYATPAPLSRGREFAFLLIKPTPPIALASTPLEWSVQLETPTEFPDDPVKLSVQVFDPQQKLVGGIDHPFVPGTKTQTFLGQAAPPAGGWTPGEHELRISLVTDDKSIDQGKKPFKIGRMNWTEKAVELKPEAVQEAEYVVAADVQVERGDALQVSAHGSMRPAPTAFYREILVDPSISSPVPSEPVGLAWRLDHLRTKYRMVDMKSNFGALVLRIGYEGTWVPYKPNVPPLLMPSAGPLHLSINSVMPREFSYAGPRKPPTKTDKSYWAADSGTYHVTILHGRFDFPVPLSDLERGGLLLRYFADQPPQDP